MNKQEFLWNLTQQRGLWETVLSEIDPGMMDEPGLPGGWSVKDMIAHVTWYEKEMVTVLRNRTLHGSELWDEPVEQRNLKIYQQNHDRVFDDVRIESRQVYADLLAEVEKLDDEDLQNPARFKDFPLDWIPWQLIASNCFEHYPEHIQAIHDSMKLQV